MAETITRLAEASKKLNEMSDEVSQAITEYSDELGFFKVGLPVWPGVKVTIGKDWVESDEDESQYEHWIELGYDKVSGEWCIATRHRRSLLNIDNFGSRQYVGEDETLSISPLKDNTRARKIEALSMIPALFDAIADTVEEAVEEMEKYTEHKNEMLKAMRENK